MPSAPLFHEICLCQRSNSPDTSNAAGTTMHNSTSITVLVGDYFLLPADFGVLPAFRGNRYSRLAPLPAKSVIRHVSRVIELARHLPDMLHYPRIQ